MSEPIVILKDKKALPFFARHPWVFAGAIEAASGDPADGAPVRLHSHSGQFIAKGLFNSKSKIRVRLYSWNETEELDEAFWRRGLERAIGLRRKLGLLSSDQACRLVFSEADELSGLVVDKFGDWLVLQFTSLALANRRDVIAGILTELLRPKGIYLRTEKGIGRLEGLELHDTLLRGEPSLGLHIKEHDAIFEIDLQEGQKTGFYVDQRDNHLAVAKLMEGRTVLDAFCYSGGFGIHAAKHGAMSVTGVDVSVGALNLARRNAELNGLSKMEFVQGDVFAYLTQAVTDGKRWSGIVLDPPKFARARSHIPEAIKGYRKMLKAAFRLAEPEAILVMCCCSGLISMAEIEEVMAGCSADAKRPAQVLERRGQAMDHPVSLACPETGYLKCLICRLP